MAEGEGSQQSDANDAELDYRSLFEGLLQFIPEGVTIAAPPNVTILMVSAFGEAITGRTAEALVGKPADAHPEQWQVYHTDGVTLARAEELPLTRATKDGELVINEPWILRRPDGRNVHILCNAGPIRNADGTIRWGIIAWRDVTALRAAEEALEAEQRKILTYKDALLQEVNHRIKNNLALIAGMLQLQARSADTDLGQQQFRDAAERISALGGLYDALAHVDEDQVEIGSYLRGIAERLQAALGRPKLPVTVSVDADLFTAPTRLATDLGIIVNELVTNACKHGRSEDGSCQVEVVFRALSGEAELSVRDRGAGPPAGFDLAKAHGIGLRLVRSLALRLNGVVAVDRKGGTRFHVRFPLEAAT